jgi:hypothetical protein
MHRETILAAGRQFRQRVRRRLRLLRAQMLVQMNFGYRSGKTLATLEGLQVPARVRQGSDGSRLLPVPQEPPVSRLR